MPFEDLSLNAVQIMNKYFIIPVESLNMSVLNLQTSVNNFDTVVNSFNTSISSFNSSFIAFNMSFVAFNTSFIAFNTSITSFNSSIISFNTSITTLNTSTIANTSSIIILNASTIANISSIIILNASTLANTSSIVTLNTSFNNAINTVNSTTLTIGGTNGTSSQSYAGSITSGTLNIATAISTGNINIGSSTATNQVNVGGVLIGANAINAETDSNFQIASTNSSGSITIGGAQTSGDLNIGVSASRTGSIQIGGGSIGMTQQIFIQTRNTNNDVANNSAAIFIGTTGVSKYIKIGSPGVSGSVSLGNLQVQNSGSNAIFLNCINSATNTINIGNTQTSGVLNIGTGGDPGIRNATGNVNIASQVGNLCDVNIMNGGGATTGGSVNIANGTLQTTTVNIASGTGTGTVTIGNSANTTTINSGTINMPEPPTMTYTTLPTIGPSQIGYTIRRIITTHTTSGATGVLSNPFSGTPIILGVGFWMMNYQLRLRSSTGTTTITKMIIYANLGTGQSGQAGNFGLYYNIQSYALTSSSLCISTFATIENNTDNNELIPRFNFDYTPPNTLLYAASDSYFSVTRIA